MCRFGITNIWWVRYLIRKISPTALPVNLKLEDVVVEWTRNIGTVYEVKQILKVTTETDGTYVGFTEDGVKEVIWKYRLGEQDKIEVLEIIKKHVEVPMVCEIDVAVFEKRLEESKRRCIKYANKFPDKARYGYLLRNLVKEVE